MSGIKFLKALLSLNQISIFFKQGIFLFLCRSLYFVYLQKALIEI
jgi:hypothetical protein